MLDIDRTNFGVDKNIGLIKKKKKKRIPQACRQRTCTD